MCSEAVLHQSYDAQPSNTTLNAADHVDSNTLGCLQLVRSSLKVRAKKTWTSEGVGMS